MTDGIGDRDAERLDLRELDLVADRSREDAAVQAVLARITARPIQQEWWAWMARAQRGLAAAAVVFVLLAASLVLTGRGSDTQGDLATLIESWVTSGQVPTNGELLTAYQGYRQ